MWLFTVTASGQGATAEAHILKRPGALATVEIMARAASSCGGTTI
jgi:hypothetical protein